MEEEHRANSAPKGLPYSTGNLAWLTENTFHAPAQLKASCLGLQELVGAAQKCALVLLHLGDQHKLDWIFS